MKIVLREDVEKLGRRGEVVRVADGYGRNYLIPKKLAYSATSGNLKVIQDEKRAKDLRDAKVRHDYEKMAEAISALSLSVSKKVGENDVLFGSVTSQEVADLLEARGIEIDKRRIAFEEPIKHAGSHVVLIKLHKDVTARLALEVVKEE